LGKVAKPQLTCGSFKIADWAQLVTVYPTSTEIVKEDLDGLTTTFILLSSLSFANETMNKELENQARYIATNYPNRVSGFVGQKALNDLKPEFLTFMPGVHISESNDGKDQNYKTPEKAILEDGADIIIVGRGITSHNEPQIQANEYRKRGWSALLQRMNK